MGAQRSPRSLRGHLATLATLTMLTSPTTLTACGAPELPDAGPVDASSDGGAPIAPPSAPVLAPCPEGWSIAMRDEVAVCDPSPTGAEQCTGASFRRAGQLHCEAVDDACEPGPFPTGLDRSRTHLYVREGASAGDGSEAAPFGTLAEAFAAVTGATTIALAEGTYAGAPLPDDVEIQGVCADRVVITGPVDAPGLLVHRGQRLVIEGVRMHTADLAILSGGALVARRLVIEGAATAGIGLIGGSLEAERVLVRDTRTASDGTFGRGITLEGGAAGTARDVVIEQSRDRGLAVAASSLTVDGLAIRDTTPNGAGAGGSSLDATEEATVVVRRAALERSVNAGVIVDGASEITLEDVVIRDVVPAPTGDNGMALLASHARAHLARVLVERSSGSGLFVGGTASLDATDLVVHAIARSDDFASGLAATGGASVVLDRVLLADTAWMGLVAFDPDTRVEARDLLVRRVEEGHGLGEGLAAIDGAGVVAERVVIEDARALGVLGLGTGTTVSLTDARIHRIRETSVHLVGRGIEADVGAHVSLTRVDVDDVVETGIVSFGMREAGTALSLERVRVTNIHERSCATSSCPTEAGGSGVAAVFGGAITARDLEVDGAPLCGVQVAAQGSLDVTSGVIRGSAIGACVQVEGYDLARIVTGVAFVDDERHVETTSVYVPGSAPAVR